MSYMVVPEMGLPVSALTLRRGSFARAGLVVTGQRRNNGRLQLRRPRARWIGSSAGVAAAAAVRQVVVSSAYHIGSAGGAAALESCWQQEQNGRGNRQSIGNVGAPPLTTRRAARRATAAVALGLAAG